MSLFIENHRRFREALLADPYRPGYHFAIPEDAGLPGDPNGAFYAGGRYHLFYLYACVSDSYRWGHLSSIDLVHWRAHPDALCPDEIDGGIFSGGAFVDDDGTAYLSYWSLPKVPGAAGGVRIARSRDRKNHYETWEKLPGYAVPATRWGVLERTLESGKTEYIGSADPSNIWRDGGFYYMQTGNLCVLDLFRNDPDAPARLKGDWTDLFRSRDMENWEFVHRFYDRREDDRWTRPGEDDMCPSFLPLPADPQGGEPTEKHLQLFIAHNRGAQYYIGDYDRKICRFVPKAHGRLSDADNTYFAPEALIGPDNRQIVWAWLLDNPQPDPASAREHLWSGVYALPRSVWYAGGHLGIAPVREMGCLRYNESDALSDVDARSCEVRLRFRMPGGAGKAGLRLTFGDEAALLYADYDAQALVMDTRRACSVAGRPAVERLPLPAGPALDLIVYIDRSVVEVFANQRQAIARRVFPKSPEKAELHLLAEGGAECERLTAWDMMPAQFC